MDWIKWHKVLIRSGLLVCIFTGGSFSCKPQRTGEEDSSFPADFSVIIVPGRPRTTDDLTVLLKGVDERRLALQYLWKRNGEEIMGETSKVLRHFNFSKHDVISVVVTPLQGEVRGTPVESNPVTVVNSPPLISSGVIRPQPADVTSQLEAVVEASDDDGDFLVFSYAWMKNGEEISHENTPLLSSGTFLRGDTIQCRITPSDREEEGSAFITEPVVIMNSPPLITSQPPSLFVEENTFSYRVVAEDPDRDPLVFSFSSLPPEGLSLDPATGVIHWEIPKGLTGVFPIEVIVSDERGGNCSQRFTLSLSQRQD